MNVERAISIVVVLVYALLSWRSAGVGAFLGTFAICAIPLALIWFAEVIGGYTGWVGSLRTVNRASPPSWLRAAGWVLLLAPAIVFGLSLLKA